MGWVGVFIALIVLGIGIGYVSVQQGGPTAGDLMYLLAMGASVAAFGFAGVYLIFRSLTDRPPTGAMVLVCNANVAGQFLVPGTVFVLCVIPAGLVSVICTYPSVPAYEFWPVAILIAFCTAYEGIILWRDGRKFFRYIWRGSIPPAGSGGDNGHPSQHVERIHIHLKLGPGRRAYHREHFP